VADGNKAIGDVRGLGLMLGTEFTAPDGSPDTETAARTQRAAADRGLLLLTCGAHNNVVRMIPALVVNEAQIDEAVRIWADAVEMAASG
jgi:4-aminobutyrate aminotransferase